MRWLAVALFAVALSAVGVAASAGTARAQSDADKAGAKESFAAGVAAYEGKQFEEALGHFQEAHRLAPHPMVQVNIANCYDALDRPVEALHHFEAFLASGVAKAEQRDEVMRALRRLRAKVGRILFQVRPDGTRVVLDGIELAHTPIAAPVVVAAGKHTVDLSLDGHLPTTRHVELEPGAVHELEVTLEPVPATVPVAVAEPTPVVVSSPSATEAPPPEAESETGGVGAIPLAVWVSGGVTAALLVSATVTGLLALDAETDFENARSLRYSTATELTASGRLRAYNDAIAAADRVHALALATDILLGAAVVGAGVTVYLYLTQRESSSALLVSPAFAHDAAGATVRARW